MAWVLNSPSAKSGAANKLLQSLADERRARRIVRLLRETFSVAGCVRAPKQTDDFRAKDKGNQGAPGKELS